MEWILCLAIVTSTVLLQLQINNIRNELDLDAMDKADLIDAFEKMKSKFEKVGKKK